MHQSSPKAAARRWTRPRPSARHLLDTRQRAKWKDLPREFGAKSAVHRYFQRWVRDGIFERILRQAGRAVAEERDGFKLYECFIDGTFAKARGGGDGG
ncbi:MAG: transposase [Phycisphaerae bacterium]